MAKLALILVVALALAASAFAGEFAFSPVFF
jgi:hypothetical protein